MRKIEMIIQRHDGERNSYIFLKISKKKKLNDLANDDSIFCLPLLVNFRYLLGKLDSYHHNKIPFLYENRGSHEQCVRYSHEIHRFDFLFL